MSEARFTKGPWLSPKGNMTKFIDARIGDGMLQEICSVGPTQETDQQLANAHLIAAAPEMYEMLIQLQVEGGLGIARHRQIDRIIKKARGEK